MLIESGQWQPWADAEPVRQHVARLRKAGVSVSSIAQMAGVNVWSLSTLINSDRPRARADFARKLLDVSIDVAALPANSKIDAAGTRRRLQALILTGWPTKVLSERLGMDRTSIRKAMSQEQVRARTAVRVRDLFEELSTQQPPPGARTRRYAQTRGWLPVAVWDDIDDPDEQPKGACREAS
ncbi:hypothetical protein ACIBHX_01685 [Nonomuraea sp. NPDC050536]|uniref:hypothetical protein n=1 Tax=Nonomuraea sp. NPDC050536 TaxID=3364366 RepID=UPI0037C8EB36